MSLKRSLDNKSSAASMNPASNSNETKINSDNLPKSSVQGNKKERTVGGSSSATLTSIPPPSTPVLRGITMFGKKLQYLVRPRSAIKTRRKAKTFPPPTVLTLEDEGFMNEGIYGSVKSTVATGKTTTNSSKVEKQHLCGSSSRPRASHGGRKTRWDSPYKTLEDEGFVNEGIYWSVKAAIASGKTTKSTKNQSSS
ncbi:hypothetical protein Pyn_37273 [Prunus yedoensis var. nudiflora]|uniref:Uncharacterized protein n=1 Tax=Prunus yedoensis var. nudiflora TaxID=2094558 RepID=A0A314YZW8_PRUYE|nr:hypothetical protein Pyn_37273 [Prunus yedoensis var. nudiflora]